MLTPAAECSTCCASQGSWPFSIRFSPTGVDTHKGDNRTTAPAALRRARAVSSRRPRGNLRWCGSSDLLSTPLTIPLCAVRSIASDAYPVVARPWPGGERGEAGGHRITRNVRLGRFSSVCGPWGVPACGVVPERYHAVGAAVDAHRDTPAWGATG